MRLNKGGFTLPELVIVLGIFSILVTVLAGVFASVVEARLRSQAETGVGREESYLLARLAYDVNRASAIVRPLPGETGTELELTIGGASYTYGVNGGQLTLTAGGETQSLVDSHTTVGEFEVERFLDVNELASVRISFSVGSDTVLPGTGVRERQIVTTLTTR